MKCNFKCSHYMNCITVYTPFSIKSVPGTEQRHPCAQVGHLVLIL